MSSENNKNVYRFDEDFKKKNKEKIKTVAVKCVKCNGNGFNFLIRCKLCNGQGGILIEYTFN